MNGIRTVFTALSIALWGVALLMVGRLTTTATARWLCWVVITAATVGATVALWRCGRRHGQ